MSENCKLVTKLKDINNTCLKMFFLDILKFQLKSIPTYSDIEKIIQNQGFLNFQEKFKSNIKEDNNMNSTMDNILQYELSNNNNKNVSNNSQIDHNGNIDNNNDEVKQYKDLSIYSEFIKPQKQRKSVPENPKYQQESSQRFSTQSNIDIFSNTQGSLIINDQVKNIYDLKNLKSKKYLQFIDLQLSNQVQFEAQVIIKELKKMTNLISLTIDINGNFIKDEEAKQISKQILELKQLQRIKVDLRNTDISSEVLQEIKQTLENKIYDAMVYIQVPVDVRIKSEEDFKKELIIETTEEKDEKKNDNNNNNLMKCFCTEQKIHY